MSKLERIRRGVERLIDIDSEICAVTRAVKTDNGRGQQVPTGETSSHKIVCRVSYQAGGVWPGKQWEGGLTMDTTPFVLAAHDANLEAGDTLKWRDREYLVGVVTRPEIDGGFACTQAPLTEVK